jgi:hypothetical protein
MLRFTDYLRPIISRLRLEPRYIAMSHKVLPRYCSLIIVSCVEIFLPSYVECDFESLERKRDPVHEIRLSDEEIKNMFPQ